MGRPLLFTVPIEIQPVACEIVEGEDIRGGSTDRPTIRPTDRPTDQPTNRPTFGILEAPLLELKNNL